MFTLKIDDGICKGFKNEDDLDFFVNKAYDEESDMHCLLIFIPVLPQYNIRQVQNPIAYSSEAERDKAYIENINDEFVNNFYKLICDKIEENLANKDDIS